MAWIQLHDTVYDSLKTQRLARALDVQVELAVGLLGRLWHWGLRDADTEGFLPEATADEVAFICRWFGDAAHFVASLIRAGFLAEAEGRYVIHNWSQYGGKLAVRKAANTERSRQFRERVMSTQRERNDDATHTQRARNAHATHTQPSRNGCVRSERREEESREDTHVCSEPGTHDAPTPTQTTDKPKKATYPKDFEAFWVAYPDRRRREKPDAYKAWVKVTGEYTVAQVMAALEVSKRSVDWTKDGGEFVPMPGRWLRRLDPDDVTGVAVPESEADNVPEPIRAKPWVFLYKAQPPAPAAMRILSMLATWGVDIGEAQGLAAQLGGPIQVADHYWALREEARGAAAPF
jgi:hypothetical protein